MDEELPLDQDGNPVFPLEEELQALIDQGEIDPDDLEFPIFNDGDGTENNGDKPKLRVLT